METKFKTHFMVVTCVMGLMAAGCNKVSFSPSAQEDATAITPPPTTPPNKTVSSSEVVAFGNKQVDFLFVLDDSNSMLPELKKLAARLSTFVSSLDASNIDWQMCLTTTRGTSSGGTLIYGTPLSWSNYAPTGGVPAYLLKKGVASNLNIIFTSTIDALTIGGGSSGDERAIKAAYEHFSAIGTHGCYRPGAAVSVIVISDEDERSVGGVASRVKAADAAGAYQPLEREDIPANLVSHSKYIFGDDVRFTFSSIIVKPGDTACEAEQDKDTSPSHPGYVYEEASRLTDGGVGSICDADYSANLNTFKDKIVNSLQHLTLECPPVKDTMKVSIDGINIASFKVEKNMLKFPYALIEGTKIDLQYDCEEGIP